MTKAEEIKNFLIIYDDYSYKTRSLDVEFTNGKWRVTALEHQRFAMSSDTEVIHAGRGCGDTLEDAAYEAVQDWCRTTCGGI